MVKARLNKRQNYWFEKNIDRGLHEVRNGGTLKCAARKYGMSDATLRNRLKMEKEKKETTDSSRTLPLLQRKKKTWLNASLSCVRQDLALVLTKSSLVQDYVIAIKIKTPYKDGRPGKD